MALHRIVKIALAAGGALAALPFAARAIARRAFEQRVKSEVDLMLAAAIDNDATVVTEADIERLPVPVQKYLRFAGVVGSPRRRTARVWERGALVVDDERGLVPYRADLWLAVFPAGYVWNACVEVNDWLSVMMRDGYFAGHAELTSKLEGLVNLVDDTGPEVNQRSLFRFLSSFVLLPSAFVDEARWEAIDDHSARVFFEDDGNEVSGVCTFSDDGRLVSFLGDRYQLVDDVWEKRRCSILFERYALFDDLVVPSGARVQWHEDDGEIDHAVIEFIDVEYDVGRT